MQYFTAASKPLKDAKKNARKTENKGKRNKEKILQKELEKLALKTSTPLSLGHIIYLKGLCSCAISISKQQ